jgi:hypothetical protein
MLTKHKKNGFALSITHRQRERGVCASLTNYIVLSKANRFRPEISLLFPIFVSFRTNSCGGRFQDQGRQTLHFRTKNPNSDVFWRALENKSAGICYGHLVYIFHAIW